MSFKQEYEIIKNYLTKNTKRRSGQLLNPGVKFIVAHDTGNPTSTARNNVDYYERTNNDVSASAHIFVDDREIIECIPALTSDKPEKAWHVRYDVPKDNELYFYEANNAAIGVEYCYGSNINADKSYDRYIWVLAYICYKYNLDPSSSIVGHFILDPLRRSDPSNGLKQSGRSYEQLLNDIVTKYNNCIGNRINNRNYMEIIKNPTSNKIYAIGADNKKHWIYNEETFNIGKDMGLWEGWDDIRTIGDDSYAEGHMILLVK